MAAILRYTGKSGPFILTLALFAMVGRTAGQTAAPTVVSTIGGTIATTTVDPLADLINDAATPVSTDFETSQPTGSKTSAPSDPGTSTDLETSEPTVPGTGGVAPTASPVTESATILSDAPSDIVTTPPTRPPTLLTTTASPTNAVTTAAATSDAVTTVNPTTSSPTDSETTEPPSDFPSTMVTFSPTVSPTLSSSPTATNATAVPTATPTTFAPTTANPTTSNPTTSNPTTSSPTGSPSVSPSLSPTGIDDTPRPTRSPTISPTPSPTEGGEPVSVSIGGVTVSFNNGQELNAEEVEQYSILVRGWFDDWYGDGGRRIRRRLAERDGARNMASRVDVTGQRVIANGIQIVYTHTLQYTALSDARDPDYYVLLPYQDVIANADLAANLRSQIPALINIPSQINRPIIEESPSPTPPSNPDDGLSAGAIAGIAIGGAAFVGIVGYVAYSSMNKSSDNVGYQDTTSLPPSQFNINAADEISTIEDPTVAKVGSGVSAGQYGDQSVATVDYDYSKAYGGGGDTSVVSSVGGTLGDNTRQTSGNDIAAASATRAALGASFDVDPQSEFKEEIIVIDAPAGKLGVVIDTPDDGAPVVHAVKDSSVIADQIQVGDKLIAVDEDDVRSMTAIKVSKLISKKSANPSRKLTIVRTTHVGMQ